MTSFVTASSLALTTPHDAYSKIQSDMAEKALYRTFKKVSGSGDKRKQSKQTGDLIKTITFATKCLVEKRGMSFATREQFLEFSILVCSTVPVGLLFS